MDAGRMSKGIKYATSEEEAFETLKQNVKDFDALDTNDMESLIGMAMNSKVGIMEAIKLAATDFDARDRERAERREERAQVSHVILGDLAWVDANYDALLEQVVHVAAAAYEDLRHNVEVPGSYSSAVVVTALGSWPDLANHNADLANIHGFPPQNKAAQGKGNVGNTLARRKIQANFISTWHGFVVNVHVNVE
jgi:hypothetical protein